MKSLAEASSMRPTVVKSGRMANSPPCSTGAWTSSPIQMTSAATARKKTWKNFAEPSHWHMPFQKSMGALLNSNVSMAATPSPARARLAVCLGVKSKNASPSRRIIAQTVMSNSGAK